MGVLLGSQVYPTLHIEDITKPFYPSYDIVLFHSVQSADKTEEFTSGEFTVNKRAVRNKANQGPHRNRIANHIDTVDEDSALIWADKPDH